MTLKTVLYPLRVPIGVFCWEYTGEHQICPQFDNDGGTPSCPFFNEWRLKVGVDGVLKSKKCLELKS